MQEIKMQRHSTQRHVWSETNMVDRGTRPIDTCWETTRGVQGIKNPPRYIHMVHLHVFASSFKFNECKECMASHCRKRDTSTRTDGHRHRHGRQTERHRHANRWTRDTDMYHQESSERSSQVAGALYTYRLYTHRLYTQTLNTHKLLWSDKRCRIMLCYVKTQDVCCAVLRQQRFRLLCYVG